MQSARLNDLAQEMESIKLALMDEYQMAAGIAEAWAERIIEIILNLAEVCNGDMCMSHLRGKDG